MNIGICSLSTKCNNLVDGVQKIINRNQDDFKLQIIPFDVSQMPKPDMPEGCYSWNLLIKTLNDIKSNYNVDFMYGLLSNQIEYNLFSWADKEKKVGFTTIFMWSKYSNDIPVEAFIALQVIVLNLEVHVDDYAELAHENPRACINDMCGYKMDINFKIKSGYICPECIQKYKEHNLPDKTIESAIMCFENIRKTALKRDDIPLFKSNAEIIMEAYPFPISFYLLKFLCETDMTQKYVKTIELTEYFLQYLSIVLFKDAEKNKLLDGLEQSIIYNLKTPSFKYWLFLLDILIPLMKRNKEKIFFKKVIDDIQSKYDLHRNKLEELANYRNNRFAHGNFPEIGQCESIIGENEPIITEILNDFIPITSYNMVKMTPISYDEDTCMHRYSRKKLHGAHQYFKEKEIASDTPIDTNSIIIFDENNNKYLILKPWLKYMVCPCCKHQRLFIYKNKENNEIVYRHLPLECKEDLVRLPFDNRNNEFPF